MKIKIIFDKEKIADKYFCGWGTSYIIGNKTLFDTGEKAEYTLKNLKALDVDISGIERIVISHNHWDHLGGLWDLLNINKNIEVFTCPDFVREFNQKLSSYNFKVVDKFFKICENIYTSGPFKGRYKDKEIEEQALLVKTDKGVSVICGCSHPGVIKFIEKAKDEFPEHKIYAVLGGFHLIDEDNRVIRYLTEEIRNLGVESIGPSHCTGFEATNVFKEVYAENFWDVKVGQEFRL
ncbi:MAG: MBL fold metallo-hydrolase [Candidatus Omnitrophica bacterium]|nr:MBL fold metallo-hydrolase [Candidatus Omnitrophota bacterium]